MGVVNYKEFTNKEDATVSVVMEKAGLDLTCLCVKYNNEMLRVNSDHKKGSVGNL